MRIRSHFSRSRSSSLSTFPLAKKRKRMRSWVVPRGALSCRAGSRISRGRYLGNLGILEDNDLPLGLLPDNDQGWTSLYFAHYIVFLEFHARLGKENRDIWTHKPDAA